MYTFKNLTGPELEQEEARFNLKISNAPLADQAWAELKDFFEKNPDLKYEYYVSYWRWFVVLSWQKSYNLPSGEFIQLVQQQVPVAILVNVDVLDVVMRYLAQNFYAHLEIGSYFAQLKKAFFESEIIMGEWQKNNILVKDLVSEYLSLQTSNADSMEKAEFMNKLKQVMFPKQMSQYTYVDQDEGVDIFLSLINFFKDVDSKNIWTVIDMYLTPQKYLNPSGEQNKDVLEEDTLVFEPVVEEGEEELGVENPIIEKGVVSTQQVKSQIESEFKKDSEGNFENIEGVMGRLSELAEENNNPSIAEMIYFDEEGNKFKWKE